MVYNGTTTTHTYGADGLRRRTVQGANTTDYLLDGQSVVRTKLNGNLDKTYFHGARGPEYERSGSNAPGWYVYDGLGSVLGITDSSGTFTSTRKYDVYGAVRSFTGSSGSKHKFVGNLGHPSEDETGLIYMRARYYDPTTGRFVSEDPALDGTNWFSYCSANPVSFTDPTGLCTMTDLLSGSADEFMGKMRELITATGQKAWAEHKIMGALRNWAQKYADDLLEDGLEMYLCSGRGSDIACGVDGKFHILFHFTEKTLHGSQTAHVQLHIVRLGQKAVERLYL